MNVRLEAFFALQRVIGSRADLRYRDFLDMERWSADRLEEWREEKIRSLLDHAVGTIPFYRDRGLKAGAPLASFPVMTKEALHDNYQSMMSPQLAAEFNTGKKSRGYGWLEVTSGGTTGVPTTVIHDRDFRDMDRAARLYEQYLCGFPFGTPHFRLWGAMEDIHKTRASRSRRLMGALARETLLNAFMMEDERIESFISRWKRTPRAFMIAYVDALEQIVRYADARDITLPRFTAIMTTGGTLTEDSERKLREAFGGARIHNKYGSRDCGELACACAEGGLHVLAPNVHIEILDDRDRPAGTGESGRVVVTFLGNPAFPLIRFDIGDVAAAGNGPCRCGNPFPVIGRVTARTVDIVQSTTGGFVTPVYIRHTVGVVHGQRKFRRYQFVQTDRRAYELSVQPETGVEREALEATLPGLRRDLLEVLGRDADLDIRFVNRLDETPGGKFRYVINRHHPVS